MNLWHYFLQWLAIRREIRGYKTVQRECRKINRKIDQYYAGKK